MVRLSRRLELAAYCSASKVVVISQAFRDNLIQKGVAPGKIAQIRNPATRWPEPVKPDSASQRGFRVLAMGNIGHSQGLAGVVRAFEESNDLGGLDVSLGILGTGVAEAEVKAEVRTDRVEMRGLVSDSELARELRGATVGLVTQRYDGTEFNTPSKLMNFLAFGLPVLAVIHPESEVARIVRESGAGWVVDSRDPAAFPLLLADLARGEVDLEPYRLAAREYAERAFAPGAVAGAFERELRSVVV
jgi:colanic acid biosynthesis glycosyl transferase WcaI